MDKNGNAHSVRLANSLKRNVGCDTAKEIVNATADIYRECYQKIASKK